MGHVSIRIKMFVITLGSAETVLNVKCRPKPETKYSVLGHFPPNAKEIANARLGEMADKDSKQ